MTTANLAVADNETVVQYVSTGETEFVYPFPILAGTELRVSVDQVPKNEGAHYTVAGVGDAGGGTVTFLAATTAGQKVTLWLELPIARLTGFALGAATLLPQALNSEFVRQVRVDQMLRRDQGRAVRVPVDDPQSGQNLELPTATARAGRFLRFADVTGNPEVAEQLDPGTILSASAIAQYLWPRNPDELGSGVVPVDLLKQDRPILDARRCGWSEANTETQNATAIGKCIQELTHNGVVGGTIQLPPGVFNCDPFEIPPYIVIRGAGARGTRLVNGDAGYFLKLGGAKTGELKYGCGISDLTILMAHKDGHAIRLMETAGAIVKRIYSECTGTTVARTGQFVTIDGGDVSSFFNKISDCIANHWHQGYRLLTTGISFSTESTFDNCTIFGDRVADPTSVGLQVDATQGTDAIWSGGNFENCGKAILAKAGAGSVTVKAGRWEDCATDIEWEATPNPWTFFGCKNLDPSKIIDNSGGGYQQHNFYGCTDLAGQRFGDLVTGATRFRGNLNSQTPVTIQGVGGQVADLWQIVNGSGVPLFKINKDGEIVMIGSIAGGIIISNGSPEGVRSAPPSTLALNFNGGAGTTLYVKESGTGNTGWVAK